ncbi:MAG: hypothetical protein Q7J78_05525, partial [Clostridiales bacterium]|nr:hypothetical protein [Clostridiales bacterium]
QIKCQNQMSKESISPREPGHPDHSGQHSHRRRLDIFVDKFNAWRQERILSHEMGEDTPLCYPGEKDGHFQMPPEIEEPGLIASQYAEGIDQELVSWENTKGYVPVPLRDTPAYEGSPNTHSDSRPAPK